MDSESLHTLSNDIAGMCPAEHEALFNIVQRHGEQFTLNASGVFVNLTKLNPVTVAAIREFVQYCKSDRACVRDYQHQLLEATQALAKQVEKPTRDVWPESTRRFIDHLFAPCGRKPCGSKSFASVRRGRGPDLPSVLQRDA